MIKASEPGAPIDVPSESRDGLVYAAWIATAILLLARIPVLARRFFDPDELQHTHDAWYTFRGLVPYRDFFEHHTPWYYYTLRPFFRWFAVDTSFESARHFLIFARCLSLVFTAVGVVLLMVVGRLVGNRRVGALAGLLLAGLPICLQKTLEIRPDVLALPLCVGGLALLLVGLRGEWTTKKLWSFAGAGYCLGGAIMCTQKMLFVLPGLFLGLGIWWLFAKVPLRPRSRFVAVVTLAIGLVIPGILTWAAFAVQGAGQLMIQNNFLLNAKWKYVVGEQLLKTLEDTWPALILCLLGATVTVYRHVRQKQGLFGEIVLLSTLFGLIVGVFVMPVAHRQYYLILLPITCVFAAKGLLFGIERTKRRRLVIGVSLVALNIMPVADLVDAYCSPNDVQMARLRLVLDRTKPSDLVMDGWNGAGVFRPHAFHYHFIHEELVPMIPPTMASAFVDSLEKGTIHPRLIALDENLILTFGSRFVRFVLRNYETTDGLLYFAKPPSV